MRFVNQDARTGGLHSTVVSLSPMEDAEGFTRDHLLTELGEAKEWKNIIDVDMFERLFLYQPSQQLRVMGPRLPARRLG